jgi:two-component system, chemotaxis family, sensor kinase CheA
VSPDPYRYFRLESRELIDQLTRTVLDLEHEPQPAGLIDILLRLAHTLKGAARVVKQHDIADHAHAIEDVLAPLRGSTQAVARQELARLFPSLEAIRERVQELERPTAATPLAMPATPTPATPATALPATAARVNGGEIDQLREHLSDTHAAAAALDQQQSALVKARQLAERVSEAVRRLGLSDRDLDAAVQDLSELVDASHRALDGVAHKLRADLAEARESAARLQFVAAQTLFAPLEMAARDAAEMAGKAVRVACQGGEIRLAADVVGVVQAALIQAVRNAVAHGLETREQRLSRGKPPQGQIRVTVQRAGAKIVFCCADDGAGVNLAELRNALRDAGDGDETGDKNELLRRLLKGGISTSKDVTQLSGRGVGLGILREAAARLRGELALRSEPGMGTEIELRVPMSSAMLDALIVVQDGHSLAIPLHAVKHTVRIAARDLVVDARGQGLVHEGNVVPFAPIGRVLKSATMDPSRRDAWSAIIIETQAGTAAVGAERLQGVQNVVVKQLPPFAPADAVIAAAYLDPEGRPQLVLDPEMLVEFVKTMVLAPANDPAAPLPLLIVDDSLTTRMLEQGILESAGYEVELAVSGEDGLTRARARPHALFLVDVEMPGIDGFEFIEQIRADAALRDTPALLVTSLGSAAHRERGMLAGADGYIDKGQFEQKEFLAMVRRLVQRR